MTEIVKEHRCRYCKEIIGYEKADGFLYSNSRPEYIIFTMYLLQCPYCFRWFIERDKNGNDVVKAWRFVYTKTEEPIESMVK